MRNWISARVVTWVGALALSLAAMCVAPGTASSDEKYQISAETWGHFQEYLGKIKNGHRPGAYVITKDGYGSYYFWCGEIQCMPGATYSQEALNACEREYNTDCVVFAVRDDIRVEYEIVGKAPSTASAPALSPAPPVAKIKVSAQVKAEIDQYLQNAQRAGRVWALAIANDGSKVGLASCQSTGGGGYFGGGGAGCNLVSGGPQEQASREAVLRCGGPTTCTLLYEGSQKKANVSVYGPGETPPVDELGAVTQPLLSAPPPATKITVSAAVQEEIEVYLRNTQRAGFAWALAIANDGSMVGVARCQGGVYFGGSSGCGTINGGLQEVTNRAAILRCGSVATCMLAFEGAQRKTNIELVGPDGSRIGGSLATTAPSTAPISAPVTNVPVATSAPEPATTPAAPVAMEDPVPASTGTYTLSDQVWRSYQAYLQKTGDGAKPGAFAITPDGKGYAYVWCEQAQCTGGRSYSQEALVDCKQDYATECVVFAVRNEIRVAYAVADPEPSRSSGVSAAALSAPPPATKVVVSSAVKAEIDNYLDNTKTSGKAWALAITNDGSEVASANCPTSGGWSGGRGCEPIKGRPQELASREAVMRCGGPAACILLYEGAQPASNVEIVTQ